MMTELLVISVLVSVWMICEAIDKLFPLHQVTKNEETS
jgi:hypothetical protein